MSDASKHELERSLGLYKRASEVDPASTRPRRAIMVIRMKLADVGWEADPTGSVTGYQEAYRALQELPSRDLESLPNRRLRASLLRRLGESFGELGRYDDAMPVLAENAQALNSMLSIDPANRCARWDLAIAINAQGNVEIQRGRPREALPFYERVPGCPQRRRTSKAPCSCSSHSGRRLPPSEAFAIRWITRDKAWRFSER